MKIHKTFQREELEKLPSEQLDRMLHEELSKDIKDAKLILALSQILEEREPDMPNPNVQEAWQTFVERYNTEIVEAPAQQKKSPYRWIGGLAAAIAIFFLVSFGIPKVAGYDNIIKLIASWTDDFFYLSAPDEPPVQNEYVFETDHPGLQQVYDAVVELGITDPVVPTWLPEGYELVELTEFPTEDGEKLHATFMRLDDDLVLYFRTSYNPVRSGFPKDKCDVESVEIGGHSVSLYSNNEKTVAIWRVGSIECFLSCAEEKSTTVSIVKSIYYGE